MLQVFSNIVRENTYAHSGGRVNGGGGGGLGAVLLKNGTNNYKEKTRRLGKACNPR